MSSGKQEYALRFQGRRLPVARDKEMARRYAIFQREAAGLFVEKNNVYNNVFVEYGVVGIYVRIRDKIATLFSTHRTESDESVVEHFLDIANYALMGAMIGHFELKPGQQCEHLYAAVNGDELGERKLRCIHCCNEISY